MPEGTGLKFVPTPQIQLTVIKKHRSFLLGILRIGKMLIMEPFKF
jgi:hypothetical protein